MAVTMEGAPVKQEAVVAVIRPAAVVVADLVVVVVTVPVADSVADSVAAAPSVDLEPNTIVFNTELEPGHRPGLFLHG